MSDSDIWDDDEDGDEGLEQGAVVKFGRDDALEEWADELLGDCGERSDERDREKVAYEYGLIEYDDLQYYDPDADWQTKDSGYAILVSPADMVYIEPTICTEVNDGNVRAKNLRMAERRSLMGVSSEDDSWGTAQEDVPLLGVNEGERKTCPGCGRSKGLSCFYAQPGNKDKRATLCMVCTRAASRRSDRVSAAEWLKTFLADNPDSPSSVVKGAAAAAGISDRSLVRARKKLRVRIRYIGPSDTAWSL